MPSRECGGAKLKKKDAENEKRVALSLQALRDQGSRMRLDVVSKACETLKTAGPMTLSDLATVTFGKVCSASPPFSEAVMLAVLVLNAIIRNPANPKKLSTPVVFDVIKSAQTDAEFRESLQGGKLVKLA
eukprot:gnl/Hemi2/16431_TR5483_c0_g2_i1.p3 gnl/Hemi2/16431_TR5483_c0_g2~~gnl/Hemi2/16431_TR5483_c0_g2_i1.p3  ORF type:complete len:130 (+),score=40.64 gnl/Hemi2/16431_TR5483_c0_g2_i1:170-559(+)